jgi:hypothetical protein
MSRLQGASGYASSRRMPSRRQRTRWACIVAFGVSWGGACTLASDDFEPRVVGDESLAPSGNGAAAAPPTQVAGCASGASCATDGEACAGRDCPAPVASERADAGAPCLEERCKEDADCDTLVCRDGCCSEGTCSDGVANGDEADVDCGGSCAARCGVGRRCRSAGDCGAGVACPASVARCTPEACDNGVLDGAEMLIDCGGGECSGCPDGTSCTSGADCASGNCSATGQCAPASCADGVRNQDELGVDCGGRCSLPCPAGSACTLDTGCTSGVCGAGNCELTTDARCCQAASCNDGVLNGGEADLDCGSSEPLCPRCEAGRSCGEDAECASGVCEAGRCCGGSSADCTRCAERLSPTVDCSTAPPGGAANCAAFLQCLTTNASVCSTRFAPGCTNDPGGACNHNTYGGNDGLGVQHATRVLTEAGCTP